MVAATRERTLSLRSRLRMCTFTVCSEIFNTEAICLFDSPCASSCRTSSSRSVSTLKGSSSSPLEWLTDNGSCYRANETRQFARMLGLEPKNTAVRSPESNGIAESFVKTIKRDYISIMPKPDGLTAAKNLAEAFEHYNEWHPHSALGYRSPREYLRQRACNGLSDNRCLEI